jgi:hypothetical protein
VSSSEPKRGARGALERGEARVRLRGLPRDQVVEIQRARMLSAAAEVVAEVGYGGMRGGSKLLPRSLTRDARK